MHYVYDDGGRAKAGFKGTTGDCACRAVAIATGRPYKEVYDRINELGKAEKTRKGSKKVRSNARTGVWRHTLDRLMAEYGFRWVSTMKVGQGVTVHMRASELPSGRIVCRLSKHYAAVIDGVLHDNHDCSYDGERAVYGYYIKD